MGNPIILALDVPTAEEALRLATSLAPLLGAVKIGSELFTSAGPEIVRKIRSTGLKVFLDLKYHDIPNTVSKAVASAVELDVQMLTIHTSGGSEMMRAAEESAQAAAAKRGAPPPLVFGVTILTSLDSNGIAEVGYEGNVGRQVERLASLAVQSGLRGLVCSPLEVAALRALLPDKTELVTPGVRVESSPRDDQKRSLKPAEALRAGATWLVIGRPIYSAPNPRVAAEQILSSIVSSS